jgi:hypothetical protein
VKHFILKVDKTIGKCLYSAGCILNVPNAKELQVFARMYPEDTKKAFRSNSHPDLVVVKAGLMQGLMDDKVFTVKRSEVIEKGE